MINAVDNNKTEFNSPLFISKELRELLKIPEPSESIDELKQKMEDMNKQQSEKLKQMSGEFKQQMEAMQKLLNDFIKNSSTSNDTKDQGDGKIDNSKI